MPLTRYQIGNEYGLADPELYRAADRDDPEAVLEGVAMAGLVGVLRQLGDLAEFAAQIFHDLHEEVMATAARGHGLMTRVQQLEAEFPSIEKAFLSQTNHLSFFSSAGVDWHPNMHIEQNLISSSDMPRFVMDSYEECRGPPRLFLLDRFDVAGAGACLKRYTDPSFFKIDAVSSEIATVEVPREKKNRKVKKKGSRWRNGETQEATLSSHAKLHQLFLEERIENSHSDPARIVRLKRRQLNGFLFDPKPGKSYMEKFLDTSSPEQKAICEVSVVQPAVKMASDNSSESGQEIHEIHAVSPVKMLTQGKESSCSSPDTQKIAVKPFADELNGEAVDRAIIKVPDPIADVETDESSCTAAKMAIEKEVVVDIDRKTEGSLDRDHSDDVASEVDNYMDARTSMESEMEIDYEYKIKHDQGLLDVGKYRTDSDANDEHLDDRTNFSDSQSVGISSLSDYGNSLSKKARSSFSCSDSPRNLAEGTQSHDEGADEVFCSTENSSSEFVGEQSSQQSAHIDSLVTTSSKIPESNHFCTEESKILDLGEASHGLCLMDSNPILLPSSAAANSPIFSSVGHDSSETPHCIKHDLDSHCNDNNGTYTADSSVILPEVVSHTKQESLSPVFSQTNPLDELDHEGPYLLSDANLHLGNALEMASEKSDSNEPLNEVPQTNYSGEISTGNFDEGGLGLVHSIVPPADFPGPQLDPGAILVPKSSESTMCNALVSEVPDARVDLLLVEHDLTEVGAPSSDENVKLEELSRETDGENVGGSTTELDTVRRDAVLFEHPSDDGSDKPGCADLVNSDDVASKANKEEGVAFSLAGGANDDGVNDTDRSCSDVDCSSSPNILDIKESLLISKDPCQRQLDFNETISRGWLVELEVQKKVEQLECAPTHSDSSLYRLGSNNHSNLDVTDHIHDSSVEEKTRNNPTASDVTKPPLSELSNQDLESKPVCWSHFAKDNDEAIVSPTCCLPETSYLEQQELELSPYQVNAESIHAVADEASSKSLDLPAPSTCYLGEPGSPFEHSIQLQFDQHDKVCVQANEAGSLSSNIQSEQVQTADNLDGERCLDASSEFCLENVPNQKLDGFKVTGNPLDCAFPSLSILPEATHISLEEVPPLPPLPPMQWRLGKVTSACQTPEREWTPVIQDTLLPMQLSTGKEKADLEISSPESLIWEPSSPSLPTSATDGQRSEHCLSEETLGHSLQQALPSLEKLRSLNEAASSQDCLTLEGTQSSNPFLTLPDITNKKPRHDFPALKEDSVQISSNMPSQTLSIEHTTPGHDRVSPMGPLIQPLSHSESGTDAEARVTSKISEGEQGNSPDQSLAPITLLEEQSQRDVITLPGEMAWLPNTLALPLSYEVRKTNGNKLPRPRNPLIDAVAAHDKSKLRKVTERVQHQIEPKEDEKDSLLEQIRTKSFNLKPATVTRPTIHSRQGPQTNLKVAAILEKANAIRQALAGSEDDDSDSWSDA
uniref:Protein SCAR n=2 Tax=Rhizophora mucronata TaxID=61149 RepID=A0A2P2LVP9_RHIMU